MRRIDIVPSRGLTALQDGAACCIIASEDFVHAHGLENQAIEIVATALTTDDPSTFESKSAMNVVGYTMTKNCADKIFAEAGFAPGLGRDQVGVLELHDCFSANEVRSRLLLSAAAYYLTDLRAPICSSSPMRPSGSAHPARRTS